MEVNNCSSIYHRTGSHTLLQMNVNIQRAHGWYNSATTTAGEKSGRSASHGGDLTITGGTDETMELIAKCVKIKETDMKTRIQGALSENQFQVLLWMFFG